VTELSKLIGLSFFSFREVNEGRCRRNVCWQIMVIRIPKYRKTIPVAIYLLQNRRCAGKGRGCCLSEFLIVRKGVAGNNVRKILWENMGGESA
jgi:hypothetical protein